MRVLVIGLAIAATQLTSCNVHKNCVTTPETIETIVEREVIIRDTVVLTEVDSSSVRIIIECDTIKNEPIITSIKTIGGNRLKPPEVLMNNGVIDVNCKAEAEELFIQWKEEYLSKQTTHTIPQLIEKPPSGWNTFLSWSGGIFWVITLLSITIYTVIKRKSKTV